MFFMPSVLVCFIRDLLFVYFDFCVVGFFSPLREIEHEIGRVKKWEGSERSQGRGKNIIKIDFMKCFKIIRKTKKNNSLKMHF